MEWIVVAVVGAILGTLASYAAQGVQMPQSLCLVVGVVGAIAGGVIAKVTAFEAFGHWTFYIAGAIVSIGLLAGGLFSFSLTNTERRV